MMDGKTLRNKLVGSEDERAVSPVIGVILMVAITVILAAVIATLVMDFGDSVGGEPVNAVVDVDATDATSSAGAEAQLTLTEMGNAENIVLRGAISNGIADESGEIDLTLDQTGDSYTIGPEGTSEGDVQFADNNNDHDFSVVAIRDDTESTVATFTIDLDDT